MDGVAKVFDREGGRRCGFRKEEIDLGVVLMWLPYSVGGSFGCSVPGEQTDHYHGVLGGRHLSTLPNPFLVKSFYAWFLASRLIIELHLSWSIYRYCPSCCTHTPTKVPDLDLLVLNSWRPSDHKLHLSWGGMYPLPLPVPIVRPSPRLGFLVYISSTCILPVTPY